MHRLQAEYPDVEYSEMFVDNCAMQIVKNPAQFDVIVTEKDVYKRQECILRGWTTAFIDAGCIVSTPTCGPCLGGYMGILAEGCLLYTSRCV